jgi:hypothetical protein
MSRRATALAVALLVLAPAACSDDGPKAGEARLEVDGEAIVDRVGGDRETVDGGTNLRSGDRVSVRDGVARMRLSGGSELELREGLGDADDTRVLMAERPVLEAGELLVTTSDAVDLEADGTEVRVTEGAARLTRAFGMSVGAYDADVALDSAGVPAEVPALRQMVVPDLGRPPRSPRPIAYNEDDSWDRRFLGAAIAVGDQLEGMAQGLMNGLPAGEGRTPGFFKLVLPGLDDETDFTAEFLGPFIDRQPGQILIGAAIADLGERGDFTSRWDDVFEFRDAGADWGIVALDQAVRSEPLVGSVEDALDASFVEAAFVPPGSTTPGATPTEPVGTPDDPSESGGTDGGPTTTAPPSTQPPPPTSTPTTPVLPPVLPDLPDVPDPPELEPVVEPVTDLLDDLLGGLLGGLGDPAG